MKCIRYKDIKEGEYYLFKSSRLNFNFDYEVVIKCINIKRKEMIDIAHLSGDGLSGRRLNRPWLLSYPEDIELYEFDINKHPEYLL